MKLIKVLTDKDTQGREYEFNGKYELREAARAVLFDDEEKIAVMSVPEKGFHKLPGGGVEKGESIEKTLERELKEETGCMAEITQELGRIIEYKNKSGEKQVSYCFIGSVAGKKGKPEFTDEERKDKFELTWLELDEAIRIFESDKPEDYFARFMGKRDYYFLIETRKVLGGELKQKLNS